MKPHYLRIQNRIFQIECIATITHTACPYKKTYEIFVNYNGGASLTLPFETKEDMEVALDKISKALKAKQPVEVKLFFDYNQIIS